MLELKNPTRTTFAALGFGLVVFMVLFSVQISALLGREAASSGEAPGGTPVAQIFYFAGFIAGLLAVDSLKDLKRLFVLPISMTALLVWCWASLSWSLSPSIGLRRIILVTMLMWTMFACVRELGYAKSLSYFRRGLAAALVVSLILVFALPAVGQQAAGGTILMEGAQQGWRGIAIDKNAFGALCGISVIVFLADGNVDRRWYRWFFAALSLICLVGSLSKTSLGVTMFVIPVAFLLSRFSPRRKAVLIPIFIYLFVGLFFLRADLIAPFSEARFSPDAFTGRGVIWNATWIYFEDHSIFGAGFGSFWAIGPDSPIFSYTNQEWVTKISQGHNGYLDLLITIGIPGLLLAMCAFFVFPIIEMLVSDKVHADAKFLAYAILFFSLGNNLTESTLLSRDTFLNVATFFALAMLHNGRFVWFPVAEPRSELIVTPTPSPIGLDVVLARNARVEAQQGSGERPVARDPFAHVDMPGRTPHPPRGREPDDAV